MTSPLPTGYTVRPPTVADAETINRLIASYNTKVIGYPDTSLDSVTTWLTDPAFRAETDGWLVLDDGGRAVDYGWVIHRTGSGVVGVSVHVPDTPVSEWLWSTALERARQIGAEHGLAEVTLESGAHQGDKAMHAQLERNGFGLHTSYWRMRVDHSGPVEAPELPPGCVLRHGPADESDRRAAYDVMVAAFSDQDGSAPRPYDEWVAFHDRYTSFDWPQLLVVELDGRVVAASDTNDAFLETDDCGYVGRLGVHPEFRGRSLAKLLLRHTFAADAQAGRVGTLLHVDTNNPTPALGLYESVGMRPVQVSEVWHLETPTA